MHSPGRTVAGFALVLACGVVATAAQAQVYKCAGSGKQPTYQDKPCAAGAELRNFETDPPPLSVVPGGAVPGSTTRAVAPPKVKAAPPAKAEKPRAGDAAERRFIHPGMNEGEVQARIGKADMTSGGKGRKLSRWTYMPVPGDPQTVTTIDFDYGKVVEVERKVIK